jgi:hypothetical protein
VSAKPNFDSMCHCSKVPRVPSNNLGTSFPLLAGRCVPAQYPIDEWVKKSEYVARKGKGTSSVCRLLWRGINALRLISGSLFCQMRLNFKPFFALSQNASSK